MKDFAGKIAVVTGAASGIGRALANRFARAGMKVVLADVEAPALDEAAREVAGTGAETLAVRTDVSQAGDVEALAHAALARFGKIHVVCNNAGVAISGPCWTHSVADWEWVLGVNLWGVIHGIRVFTPILLAQNDEGHIVNTGSVAGLTSGAGMSIYNVSKHGVVTLSETLHHELTTSGARVHVSVLCPGLVSTRIFASARNRPQHLASSDATALGTEEMEDRVRRLGATGLSPAVVAERVLDAIVNERFYVLPHPEYKKRIRARLEDIMAERNPRPMDMNEFLDRDNAAE